MSSPTQDVKWSNKILLQFGRARESYFLSGQQNLAPNLKLYYPMVLVILSLFTLLCILYSSLSSSNNLLHPRNNLYMSLTLNPIANHNVYGVYQFLPKNKLSWR